MAERICSAPDCERTVYRREWCQLHYNRWRRYRDVTIKYPAKRKMRPLVERLMEKVDKDGPNGCWVWTGAVMENGYGVMGRNRHDTGSRLAHRISYEVHIGAVPDGLQLDHLCRNRACVNPAHLEPVTQLENVRRGVLYRLKPAS